MTSKIYRETKMAYINLTEECYDSYLKMSVLGIILA